MSCRGRQSRKEKTILFRSFAYDSNIERRSTHEEMPTDIQGKIFWVDKAIFPPSVGKIESRLFGLLHVRRETKGKVINIPNELLLYTSTLAAYLKSILFSLRLVGRLVAMNLSVFVHRGESAQISNAHVLSAYLAFSISEIDLLSVLFLNCSRVVRQSRSVGRSIFELAPPCRKAFAKAISSVSLPEKTLIFDFFFPTLFRLPPTHPTYHRGPFQVLFDKESR